MFKLDLSDAIIAMVEIALPRGVAEKALFVPIELRVGELATGTLTRHLAFFFWRPSNYTLVGTQIDSMGVYRHPKDEFENVSFHDSCWRTDGVHSVISKAYFAMCHDVSSNVAPTSLKKQARIVAHNATLHGVESVEFDRNDHKKPIKVFWSK